MTKTKEKHYLYSFRTMVLHLNTTKDKLCSRLCNVYPKCKDNYFHSNSRNCYPPKLKAFSVMLRFQIDIWFSQFLHSKIKS